MNQTIPAFFEGNGFEVISITGRGFGVTKSDDIWRDPPDKIAQFAIQHCAPETDGLFMSCTSWHAFSVADQVEQAIGRQDVTSNQATIWATMHQGMPCLRILPTPRVPRGTSRGKSLA